MNNELLAALGIAPEGVPSGMPQQMPVDIPPELLMALLQSLQGQPGAGYGVDPSMQGGVPEMMKGAC